MASLSVRGRRVVVVGAGKSGLAAVRLLLREGAAVTLEESKTLEQLGGLPDVLEHPSMAVKLGRPLDEASLAAADLIVVSPGVPLALPPLKAAREAGKPVIGEVELAWRYLPHDVPWVGITGTNGKSTTTALAGELFRQAGLSPFVGGNLGTPLSDAAMSGERYGAFVVELSSFQLEGMEELRVNAAAVLNLTPDHLDRYDSHAAYGAAKARIFRAQGEGDVAVVNADDSGVVGLSSAARVPVYAFSAGQPSAAKRPFSGLAVTREGGFTFEFGERARFSLQNRALRGRHNQENAMAAALLAASRGLPREAIQRGLDSYPGLPHRLELVRMLRGVEWVNDSKATNVDSAVVGLNAFAGGKVWLIAGGKGKGAPYAPLKAVARGKVVGVLTIGEDAPALERELGDELEVLACGTLERAVTVASERAREGDVVLLSPACASYDQFKNFEHRGETFKCLVLALP